MRWATHKLPFIRMKNYKNVQIKISEDLQQLLSMHTPLSALLLKQFLIYL